jgi:hypothetical protein
MASLVIWHLKTVSDTQEFAAASDTGEEFDTYNSIHGSIICTRRTRRLIAGNAEFSAVLNRASSQRGIWTSCMDV